MKKLDIAVLVLYIVAMVVIYFFWKCSFDLWFTVIALVVVAIATVWMIVQHNKLKKLQEKEQERA